jgi:hypothetical protein
MKSLLSYCLWIGLCLAHTAAAAMTEDEMFFKGAAEVNEGELLFLTDAPAAPVHHHQNHIVVTEASLVDGWVRLSQCHSHIDAVPSSQITYGDGRIRDLRVTRFDHIGKAWVEGNTVQMRDIAHEATICIEAETRALEPDGQGGFMLKNGPYMRGFLDGYYPMHVTMTVRLQVAGLRFLDIEPAPQPGFKVNAVEGEVGFDTLFEGRLNTRIRFFRDQLH